MDRFTKAMITNMKLNMDKNDEEVLPLIDNDSLQAENSMAMTITAEPLESDTSKRETEEKDQDAGSEDEDDDASKDEPKKSIWNGLREAISNSNNYLRQSFRDKKWKEGYRSLPTSDENDEVKGQAKKTDKPSTMITKMFLPAGAKLVFPPNVPMEIPSNAPMDIPQGATMLLPPGAELCLHLATKMDK